MAFARAVLFVLVVPFMPAVLFVLLIPAGLPELLVVLVALVASRLLQTTKGVSELAVIMRRSSTTEKLSV
jgi:hypothetical protein